VGWRGAAGTVRGAARVTLVIVSVLALGVGIVAAGTPARGRVAVDTSEVLDRVPHAIDPATFPAITVSVESWDGSTAIPIAQGILVTLAEDLELENQALVRRDATILTAADHGDRLSEMRARVDEARSTGRATIARYAFESVNVVVISPFGVQTGGSIGLVSKGTVTKETVDPAGAVVDRTTEPFHLTFAVRRPFDERWLLVGVLPPAD